MAAREQLAQWATGYWVSQMLYVACRLQLADALSTGPQSTADLASRSGAQPEALFRLLRGLASLGVFEETAPHTFALTPLAEFLQADHPQSLRPLILMMGATQYDAWGALEHSVRTGETGFQHRHGRPLFEHLRDHPEEAAIFDQAMVSIHGRETAAIRTAYDFTPFRTAVDVGGGNGSQLIELLQHTPGLRGTVFDLPDVAERARTAISAAGLEDRCDAVGGSFFDSVPAGADAYLLRHIIHDWYDAESIRILAAIRAAIPAQGKLLIIETVIPPGNDPCFAKLLDLTMLVVPGGKERTAEEYRALLSTSGFELTRIVPTSGGVDVIEAVPV